MAYSGEIGAMVWRRDLRGKWRVVCMAHQSFLFISEFLRSCLLLTKTQVAFLCFVSSFSSTWISLQIVSDATSTLYVFLYHFKTFFNLSLNILCRGQSNENNLSGIARQRKVLVQCECRGFTPIGQLNCLDIVSVGQRGGSRPRLDHFDELGSAWRRCLCRRPVGNNADQFGSPASIDGGCSCDGGRRRLLLLRCDFVLGYEDGGRRRGHGSIDGCHCSVQHFVNLGGGTTVVVVRLQGPPGKAD